MLGEHGSFRFIGRILPLWIHVYSTRRGRREDYRGFTIIELLIVIAIMGTLFGIAVALYGNALASSRIAHAIGDIKTVEGDITLFYVQNRRYPLTLAEVGHGETNDPWGNPYQYLNFETVKGKGKMRKDRSLVPINSDYDLYSMGPDGQSQAPLTASASHDDIIRASDGSYVGPASEY
jgi:general secretion pathway protein G